LHLDEAVHRPLQVTSGTFCHRWIWGRSRSELGISIDLNDGQAVSTEVPDGERFKAATDEMLVARTDDTQVLLDLLTGERREITRADFFSSAVLRHCAGQCYVSLPPDRARSSSMRIRAKWWTSGSRTSPQMSQTVSN